MTSISELKQDYYQCPESRRTQVMLHQLPKVIESKSPKIQVPRKHHHPKIEKLT